MRAINKVAIVGAGKMGMVVATQLPETISKLIVDLNEESARKCADKICGTYSSDINSIQDCDIVALVVPPAAVEALLPKIINVAKKGAIVMNMATMAEIDDKIKEENPEIEIIDCKIIGNAFAISRDKAPSCVIVETENKETFEKIRSILPGYTLVEQGNAKMVNQINGIGTKEALRCGLIIKEQLKKMNLSEEIIRIVLYTVAAGTIRAMVSDNLGGNSIRLMEEIRDMKELPFEFEIPRG